MIRRSIANITKSGAAILPGAEDYIIHTDCRSHGKVAGWAKSKTRAEQVVVLKIADGKRETLVLADRYRGDVLNANQHPTGFCGFEILCTEDWDMSNVQVVPVGLTESQSDDRQRAPVFYIHIPKTAGTSFRAAAFDFFGDAKIIRNYGPKSPETSPLAKQWLIGKGDFPSFYRHLITQKKALYIGHVHARPANHVFPIAHIATTLRNPVDQVLSHYNHFKRWRDYSDSLEAFVKTPTYRNLQSRLLKTTPIYMLGCFGLTEHYLESLEVFNAMYQTSLKTVQVNVNEAKSVSTIDEEARQLIIEHNHEDMALYELAEKIFNERLRLHRQGLPWCYGASRGVKDGKLLGTAFFAEQTQAVVLEILHREDVLAEVAAKEHRANLLVHQVPNWGHVGFHYKVPKGIAADELQVRIKQTGQILINVM